MKPNIIQASFYIDRDLHRKLRLLSLLKNESVSARVEALIKDYLKENEIVTNVYNDNENLKTKSEVLK